MSSSYLDLHASNLHVDKVNVSSNKITATNVYAEYLNGVLVEDLIEASGIENKGSGTSQFVIQPLITVEPGESVQAAIDAAAAEFSSTGNAQWIFLNPGDYPETSLELKSGVYMQSFGEGAQFPSITSLTIAAASSISIVLTSIHITHAGTLTIPDGSTMVLSLKSCSLVTTSNVGIDCSAATSLSLVASQSEIVAAQTAMQSTGAGVLSLSAKFCDIDGSINLAGSGNHVAEIYNSTIQSSGVAATLIGASSGNVNITVTHCFSLQNVFLSLNGTATALAVHNAVLAVGAANYIIGTGDISYGTISVPAGENSIAGTLTATTLPDFDS